MANGHHQRETSSVYLSEDVFGEQRALLSVLGSVVVYIGYDHFEYLNIDEAVGSQEAAADFNLTS